MVSERERTDMKNVKLQISFKSEGTSEEKDQLRDKIIFFEKLVEQMKRSWRRWEWNDDE